MNLDKLINNNVMICETFMESCTPRNAIEKKTGDATVTYNGLVLHDRCVIDSGSVNGDSALLELTNLRFLFNTDNNSFKYASITFKGLIVESENKDSNDAESRWMIGLKDDDGNSVFALSPYITAIGTRARLDYLNQSNEMDISRNYKIYDGYRSDITFQFYASQHEFRVLKNGIVMNPTSPTLSAVPCHGLNGKTLHPFLYAKNVNGKTRIALDAIEITAIPIINVEKIIYN